MRIRKVAQLLLVAVALLLVSGCSKGRKSIAVVPSPPPLPPPLAQNLPLPSVTLPPAIESSLQPTLDPVLRVIGEAEEAFKRGEEAYNAGHLEAAKEEFNVAIQDILQAPVSVREDKRLLKKFHYLVARIYAYELEALKQGDGFTEQFYEPAPLDEMATLTFSETPDNPEPGGGVWADAANTVSDLPLVVNKQVAKLIQYFCCSRRGRAALEAGLRRSGRFRDMILRILGEEEVPLDLLYLAQAESSFHPLARSRAGATGLWQFMAYRAKEYGLQRNWWLDERLNPEKATRAAAKHLKDLYNRFGDWYLALAAYNAGPVAVQRAVERAGDADFWKLSAGRALPTETRNYVPIILALTIIGKNPDKYGLANVLSEAPWVYDTVTVTSPVDLRLVAEIVGSNVETIRELNPSLLRMTTPNVAEYDLRIPLATKSLFLRRIALIPPEKQVWWRWHTVRYGETLSGIAQKFKVSVKAITEVNNLDPKQTLRESAELVIPVTGEEGPGGRHRVRPRETLSSIARRYNVSVTQLMAWNLLENTEIHAGSTLLIGPPSPPSDSRRTRPQPTRRASRSKNRETQRETVIHQVQRGESLWKIAANYNTSVEVLKRNNSHLGRTLQVGDRVVIPASQ